ncbi:condensation domain-containing protein, partial [Rugamonas sp. A1-17]|nr:condensation domain-containing protein [Rugamonas sp. A1-17]
ASAATLRAAALAEAAAPFDLERGPLVRAHLLRQGDAEHTLLITAHHLVLDGWSVTVLLRELETLYAAFVQGRPDPLPALPVQYADYALWERAQTATPAWQAEAAFWQRHMEGAPAVLQLPFDRPRPAQQDFRGARLPLQLDAALTAR